MTCATTGAIARSSFLPCRIEAARLPKTSFGSLSRSCLTPRMLTPKYWEVGPGIPSLLKPRAIRGSRVEISLRRSLRVVIPAAVMAVCDGENVGKSALTAHLIDKIVYLGQKTQARSPFSCVICKNAAKRLRSAHVPTPLSDSRYLRRHG